MTPISAVLIAQNEERTIGDALASVGFCDEVVLVDSGSADGTREVAEAAGARVVVNAPWPGFVTQRDFAVRTARHEWVIALDADERVSPPLRAEIESLRARGFDRAGYRIPRVACYLGCWIRGTDWYPDWQVRLFDRSHAGWQGDLVRRLAPFAEGYGPVNGTPAAYVCRDFACQLPTTDPEALARMLRESPE